jgi:hypothetical protein
MSSGELEAAKVLWGLGLTPARARRVRRWGRFQTFRRTVVSSSSRPRCADRMFFRAPGGILEP